MKKTKKTDEVFLEIVDVSQHVESSESTDLAAQVTSNSDEQPDLFYVTREPQVLLAR